MKLFYFFLLFLFESTTSFAQTHSNSWFRFTLNTSISEKIKTDIEFNYRTQNNLASSNPLDKNLLKAFRPWLYYKQNKNVVFALSPFAYFLNYKIIQNDSDAVAKPTNEYRFTASVELQYPLATKLYIVDRTALEYRIFDGLSENTTRFRNRLIFRYDFNSYYNLAVGDELLLNTFGSSAQNIFDHNRIITTFSYKPNPILKFDVGYIYSSKSLKGNINLIEENNFYLNFTYTLLNKKSQ